MRNWTYFTFFIALVFAAVIVYLLLKPEPPRPGVQIYEDSIQTKKREIDSLILRERQLREELKRDSSENARTQRNLKREILALKKEVSEKTLSTSSVPQLDSVKDVVIDELVMLSDTTYCIDLSESRIIFSKALKFDTQALLIDKQDSLITLMEKDKVVTWGKFNQILDNEREKFKVSQEINDHLNEITSIYKDTDKKLRRQNKLLKVAVPVALVGGFLIAR